MSRVHYAESQVEVAAFGSTAAFECDDAEVWIDAESMLISYFDDEGVVVLEGRPDGEGGWNLHARSRPRRAFLAPMAEAPGAYAGEIDEQGDVARWVVRLGEPDGSGAAD